VKAPKGSNQTLKYSVLDTTETLLKEVSCLEQDNEVTQYEEQWKKRVVIFLFRLFFSIIFRNTSVAYGKGETGQHSPSM